MKKEPSTLWLKSSLSNSAQTTSTVVDYTVMASGRLSIMFMATILEYHRALRHAYQIVENDCNLDKIYKMAERANKKSLIQTINSDDV